MQIRHGAALALREVLRHQADAAGVLAPVVANPTGVHPRVRTLSVNICNNARYLRCCHAQDCNHIVLITGKYCAAVQPMPACEPPASTAPAAVREWVCSTDAHAYVGRADVRASLCSINVYALDVNCATA